MRESDGSTHDREDADRTLRVGGATGRPSRPSPDEDATEAIPSLEKSGPAPAGTGSALRRGVLFGAYRIERQLGSGGMGEVYEAEHVEDGHRVALKVLSSELFLSGEHRERFLREGHLAAAISHPRSLYVYETDEVEGRPIIVMELASGGTLRDQVEAHGPYAPQDAVALILQVIDGLAAAQASGILHRDVKPANCFLDRGGGVKVGDYGLAIPSGGEDRSHLTTAGTFVGTPAYASPEQVRGSQLDVRSDIYSVGATLYYLLTGRTPFADKVGFSLMAAILENQPPSPNRIQADVPRKLSAIVLKCLAKDPAERHATYKDLRRALAPFAPSRAAPAERRARLAAGLIDFFFLGLAGTAALLIPGIEEDSVPGVVLAYLLMIVIAGTTEGLAGISVGRAILGLRVMGVNGATLGPMRGLGRAAVFWLIPAIANGAVYGLFSNDLLRGLLSLLGDLTVFSLFLGARSINGWAGFHDRLFHATVVRRTRRIVRFAAASSATADRPSGEHEPIGPYAPLEDPASSGPGDVVRALDPRLGRPVWIHLRQLGSAPVSEHRRILNRWTRTRWLQSRRTESEAWDVHEAIRGQPFLEVARDRVPWSRVRLWALDLTEEIVASAAEAPSLMLGLDRIWITEMDRAVLLDFPSPRSSGRRGLQTEDVTEVSTTSTPSLTAFLHRFCMRALEGSGASAQDGPPSRVLPLHATTLIERLEEGSFATLEELQARVRGVATQRAEIRPANHAARFAILATPALIAGFAALLGSGILSSDAWLALACIQRHDRIRPAAGDTLSSEARAEKEALEIYLSGPLRPVVLDSAMALPATERRRDLFERWRPQLREVLSRHPEPGAEEVAQAETLLESFLERTAREESMRRSPLGKADTLRSILENYFALLVPFFLLGAIVPGGLRWGRLAAVAVRANGRPASRRRMLLRELLVVALPVLAVVVRAAHVPHAAILFHTAMGLFLAGVVWLLLHPTRGIQDRIAGTWLVPK